MGSEKDAESLASANSSKAEKKPSSFPKSLFFIIGNEFCERYSFYGMHTILILYLTIFLKFDDDTATIIYHSFIAVSLGIIALIFEQNCVISALSYFGTFEINKQ